MDDKIRIFFNRMDKLMKQGKIQNQKFVVRHKDMPFENLFLDIEDHEQITFQLLYSYVINYHYEAQRK